MLYTSEPVVQLKSIFKNILNTKNFFWIAQNIGQCNFDGKWYSII